MQLPLLGCPRLGKQADTMREETHSDLSRKATDIPGKAKDKQVSARRIRLSWARAIIRKHARTA